MVREYSPGGNRGDESVEGVGTRNGELQLIAQVVVMMQEFTQKND